MTERMTAEQVHSSSAALIGGTSLEDFKAAHPEYPVDDLEAHWKAVEDEVKNRRLKPGQYWGIGKEW